MTKPTTCFFFIVPRIYCFFFKIKINKIKRNKEVKGLTRKSSNGYQSSDHRAVPRTIANGFVLALVDGIVMNGFLSTLVAEIVTNGFVTVGFVVIGDGLRSPY